MSDGRKPGQSETQPHQFIDLNDVGEHSMVKLYYLNFRLSEQ